MEEEEEIQVGVQDVMIFWVTRMNPRAPLRWTTVPINNIISIAAEGGVVQLSSLLITKQSVLGVGFEPSLS